MAKPIDTDEVRKLLDSIERDMAGLRGDEPKLELLRAEVRNLRELLQAPGEEPHRVHDALHGLRATLDDALEHAKAEGITIGSYITQIGHMLGL
jgi:hypothetical protein